MRELTTHSWIEGIVFVNDDISTVTHTDSENDIDVQLWILRMV
jgi:hypothetical protein